MFSTLKKLSDLLDKREKRLAVLLFFMMMIMAMIEALGILSVMPLIGVLSNPELIETNKYLAEVYNRLQFTNVNSFLIFLSAAVFVVTLIRTGFSALTTYAVMRYAQMRSHSLSLRLLASYLKRPYAWFLNRHSADIGKSVLSEADEVVRGSLIPALEMSSQIFITCCIFLLLVIADPTVAITLCLVIGTVYGLIYFFLRAYIKRSGQQRYKMNRQRFKIVQEVFSGIKEIKIGGIEVGYITRFSHPSYRLAYLKSRQQVLRLLPKYILHVIATGTILIVVMVLLHRGGGELSTALPILTLYGLAGFRLLPAMQNIYKDVVSIKHGAAALNAVHADLHENIGGETHQPPSVPMVHDEAIELRDLSYTYPQAEKPALRDIQLRIPARTTVGFVGSTGAGKSTIVDVLLGLLEPQSGAVFVDGNKIDAMNLRAWQRSIGYVPQQIFLTDDTVAGNIAFGMPRNKINMEAVEKAARMAALHEFVTSELPQAYDTPIGERGVRLSGGQRQRIGIARALYHDPAVLVLDEATSALDNLTEAAVMDAIHNLAQKKTIILIAHRLTTVRACDQIFLMKSGKIKNSGTYEELLNISEDFVRMTRTS